MRRQLRSGNEDSSREGVGAVHTRRTLLTSEWTADVATLETAIGQFTVDRALANDCQVVFFETPGDGQLHVNVTHEHQTKSVAGWAGPAKQSDGFVHNRRFADAPPSEMIRQIRKMVFAERDRSGNTGSVE